MNYKLKFWPGILPAYVLFFLPLCYIINIEQLNIQTPVFIIRTVLFIGVVIIMILYSFNGRISAILSNLNTFYVYIFYLVGVLLILSLLSKNPIYSLNRSLFSTVSLALTFSVFYLIQYHYIRKRKWQNFFEISSAILLFIVIIGQLLIPEWSKEGGTIRLTGGVNSNTIAFLGLYILIQTHINTMLSGYWSRLQKMLWLTSLFVVIWSFSRSTLLTLFITYLVYFMYLTLLNFSESKKHKRSKNFKITSILRLICITLLFFFIILGISKSDLYNSIIERLFNEENVVSRSFAWDILLDSFKENPLFGNLGWWGATKEIAEKVYGIGAHSPHSLFVRLLSEVGIIGMIAVLTLPIFIMFLLVYYNTLIKRQFNNSIGIFLFGSILAMFLGQLFEDRYLVDIFSLSNNIVIWFLSFSVLIFHISVKKNMKDVRKFIT